MRAMCCVAAKAARGNAMTAIFLLLLLFSLSRSFFYEQTLSTI
jgi:hypothetical protein